MYEAKTPFYLSKTNAWAWKGTEIRSQAMDVCVRAPRGSVINNIFNRFK